ncbi:hypothetical protein BMS3Abin05_00793 [bacterium BMS3Abin05]|nr:hypothetical protein BMS3Abin05_00793 [bacterium BMS3Abin05]
MPSLLILLRSDIPESIPTAIERKISLGIVEDGHVQPQTGWGGKECQGIFFVVKRIDNNAEPVIIETHLIPFFRRRLYFRGIMIITTGRHIKIIIVVGNPYFCFFRWVFAVIGLLHDNRKRFYRLPCRFNTQSIQFYRAGDARNRVTGLPPGRRIQDDL